MRYGARLLASGFALSVVLAACSDDDSDGDSSGNGGAQNTSGSGATPSGGGSSGGASSGGASSGSGGRQNSSGGVAGGGSGPATVIPIGGATSGLCTSAPTPYREEDSTKYVDVTFPDGAQQSFVLEPVPFVSPT